MTYRSKYRTTAIVNTLPDNSLNRNTEREVKCIEVTKHDNIVYYNYIIMYYSDGRKAFWMRMRKIKIFFYSQNSHTVASVCLISNS